MSIRTPGEFDALVARIKEQDREIKAWRAFSGNSALKAARIGEFDHAPRPLEGLTVGVKDIIDVEGLPTRYGSPLFGDAPPAERDATVVARMREAGAIIVGKTVTTELATFVPAETRNPRDRTRTPGGSSSGSAAAVAAGHVDIAIGTQTAGSIIRPAAYCGVYGFKPSFGLVPTDGVVVQCPSFDTVGVFARSLEHIEAWVATVGTPANPNPQPVAAKRPLRIGFLPNLAELDVSAEMQSAIKRAAQAWTSAGHQSLPISLPSPLSNLWESHRVLQQFESARVFRGRFKPADQSLRQYVRTGERIDPTCADRARREIASWLEWANLKSAGLDMIVLPSAPGVAPMGLHSTGNPDLARLASAVGRAAINVPSNQATGLGIQLISASEGNDLRFIGMVGGLLRVEKPQIP